MEAEQDSSIRIEDLTKVGMVAVSGRLKSDWYHLKRVPSLTPMIVQVRFMTSLRFSNDALRNLRTRLEIYAQRE
jgi:hypothetical protein